MRSVGETPQRQTTTGSRATDTGPRAKVAQLLLPLEGRAGRHCQECVHASEVAPRLPGLGLILVLQGQEGFKPRGQDSYTCQDSAQEARRERKKRWTRLTVRRSPVMSSPPTLKTAAPPRLPRPRLAGTLDQSAASVLHSQTAPFDTCLHLRNRRHEDCGCSQRRCRLAHGRRTMRQRPAVPRQIGRHGRTLRLCRAASPKSSLLTRTRSSCCWQRCLRRASRAA